VVKVTDVTDELQMKERKCNMINSTLKSNFFLLLFSVTDVTDRN